MHRMRITQKGKKMNSKNQQKKKEIDWMITLVPLALIVALCIVFFFAPEQSNQVLGQIRFLFGDTFGTVLPDHRTWHFLSVSVSGRLPNTEILCLESRMRSQNIPFLHGDA